MDRFDVRSERQFRKDIFNAHRIEAAIILRLAIDHHSEFHEWLPIKSNGVDMTGNFIPEQSKVTAAADYILGDQLIEVTRSDSKCKVFFHEKENKIRRCLKDNANLVFVNGFSAEKHPQYLNLNPKEIEHFTEMSKNEWGIVGMLGHRHQGYINKPSYRYKLSWFHYLWKRLPNIQPNLPEQYNELVNFINK